MADSEKTILLVEDDLIIAIPEQKTIEKQGYNVVHAFTGEEAVELINRSEYTIDLILMDIDLGSGIDGTEAAQIILRDHDIPIIFLSSHSEQEVIDKVEKITSYGYILKGSNPSVFFASVRMAFRLYEASRTAKLKEEMRKESEEDLKHSYELLKYFIKHAQAAIAIHDRDLKYLYVSDRYLTEYKVKITDVIGKHHYDVFPDLPEKWRTVHQKALQGIVSYGDEDPYPREDGSLEWTKWECRPWHDIEGNIGGIIVYTEVITEKVNAVLELKKYASIFENAKWGIAIVSADGSTLMTVNPECARMHGHSLEEMKNFRFGDVFPPQEQLHMKDIFQELMEKGYISTESLHVRGDGTRFPVQMDAASIKDKDGNVQFHVFNVIDISEKKKAEEKLRQMLEEKEALLKEKEVLLKETHHRVKNNLQIISSLLGLQSELVNKKNYEEAFNDSRHRVKSMAIVHEMLYRRNDFAEINFKDYADQLLSFLRSSIGNQDLRIVTEYGENDIILEINMAINLGLILNELISNALKYGYSADKENIVSFRAANEGGVISIKVRDNGPGFPEDKFHLSTDTLGLTLVRTLIRQLNGEVELTSSNGTEYRITIPLK